MKNWIVACFLIVLLLVVSFIYLWSTLKSDQCRLDDLLFSVVLSPDGPDIIYFLGAIVSFPVGNFRNDAIRNFRKKYME